MSSFSASTLSSKVLKGTNFSSRHVSKSIYWLAFLRSTGPVNNGCQKCRMMSTQTNSASGPASRQPSSHGTRRNDLSKEKLGWVDLGLRKNLIEGIVRAYPDVVAPTPAQARFIPAILEGRDLLVKDDTGSGKSFGIVLGLLGKPRVKFVVSGKPGEERESVTALVLVPQSNLAHQYYQWIYRIAEASNSAEGVNLYMDRIVQKLVRENQQHLSAGMMKLQETKPHILISTPQAMVDLYTHNPDIVSLKHLSAVVVDEADYLIETVPRKDPERSWGGSYNKAMKKIVKHPGHTRELLDMIYVARKEMNTRNQEWEWDYENDRPYRKGAIGGSKKMPGPQLIMSSATLRTHLSNYLYEESGWLNKENVLKVKNTGSRPVRKGEDSEDGEEERRVREAAKSGRVKHCVIEVSDREIRNVEGAVTVVEDSIGSVTEELEAQKIFSGAAGDRQKLGQIQDGFIERYQQTKSPFNPNALEAIATAVALAVPKIALLIIPSSAPVFRAVYELREMGLDARVFDPQKPVIPSASDEDPTLLVTTVAMARGLDLPDATHVFSLGIPDGPQVSGRSIDGYTHVSGRVGRFGRPGTVVTVVEAGQGEMMRRILRSLGVAPVRFRQFE